MTDEQILRAALEEIATKQPQTLARLRERGVVFKHAPLPNPDDFFELVAFSIYNDLCEVDLIARSALEGTGEKAACPWK